MDSDDYIDVYEKIKELKLIPVVIINNIEHAIPLGKALLEAGLPVIEITFRTEAAAESITQIVKRIPELFVGAGTVLKIEQVKAAVNAGSQFIVTPGFNPQVVDYCVENNITIIPGLNTPTMVEWALERGITLVKFFPADISGGPKMLKVLSGPYPTMKFIPTGGINNSNMIDYLKLDNVMAVGGSWIVKKELIESGKFNEIMKLIKEALSLIKSKLSPKF
ncbi:MAG: bifunctional 4-hydroxy-2-oxoglutarate aldolase/2-dehydro-3-deoxy-phosphogluconate aldolase [Candidatus Odinarchaeota archaeon]